MTCRQAPVGKICDGEFAGPAACVCGHPERHVEITDEMVERAARVIRPYDFGPDGLEHDRDATRELAREALTAAFQHLRKPQEDNA